MAIGSKRYHEVDAARVIVMFLAVFIHSVAIYSPLDPAWTHNSERYQVFEWLTMGLNLFVASPTFLIVGGFFAALLLQRYDLPTFVWRRTLRLGAPLVTSALTVGLLVTYLRYETRHYESAALDFFSYLGSQAFWNDLQAGLWMHQTWFLVALIPCVLMVAFGYRVLRSNQDLCEAIVDLLDRLSDRLDRLVLGWFLLLVLLTSVQVIFVSLPILFLSDFFQHVELGPIGFISPFHFAMYSVYFLFGVALFASKRLYALVFRWSWPLFAFSLLGFIFADAVHPSGVTQAGPTGTAFLGLHFMFRWSLCIVFLQIVRCFFSARPRPTMLLLSDAAMTVYLVHYLLVYLAGNFFASYDLPVSFEMILIFAGSALLSIAFHFAFVAQSPLLRLLLNGQTSAPQFDLAQYFDSLREGKSVSPSHQKDQIATG